MGDEGDRNADAEIEEVESTDIYEYEERKGCKVYKYPLGILMGLNKPQPAWDKGPGLTFMQQCPKVVELPRKPIPVYVDDFGRIHSVVDIFYDEIMFEEIDWDNAYPHRDENEHGWYSKKWADELINILFDKKISKWIEGGTDIYLPMKKKEFVEDINLQDENGDSITLQAGSLIYYTDGTTQDISGLNEPVALKKGVKGFLFIVPVGTKVAEITIKKYFKTMATTEQQLDGRNFYCYDDGEENGETPITDDFADAEIDFGFTPQSFTLMNDEPDTGGHYIEWSWDGSTVAGRLYPGETFDEPTHKGTIYLRGEAGDELYRLWAR